MKKNHFLIVSSLTLGLSGYAFAAPVCNASNACETPVAAGQGGLIINAASLSGIQCVNSVGPNGNQVNSSYFFAVTTSNLGPTVGTINNSGNGTTVVGVTPTHNGSATPSSTVTAGSVQGTKGGTTYFVYAQACPNGTSANGTNCSLWAQIDASQVTTTAYPASVFAAPVKPNDSSVTSISARTAVPNGDVNNVSVINLTIDDLINAANNQTLASITYVGNASPYTVDNTLFTNGFNPNNKYQYTGQVQYPWDLVPTGGPQTEGPLWTRPEKPGTVTTSNVTHCSVQITAQNSGVATPNPTYTEYQLCATGSCATTGRIGGTPLSSDTTNTIVSGLNPGTLYTPNATALVGNQDGSSAGWGNSAVTNGANFTTLAWGGTFTIGNITTTSADFTIASLTGAASIASWVIKVNGSTVLSGSGDPTGTHTLSGLTTNTVYNTAQIVLTETSGCFSTLNFVPASFTTTPVVPTTFTLNPASPFSLTAGWATAGNPGGTIYQVQYCTDAGFTQNCQTKNSSAGATSATLSTGVNPATTYFAHVKALTIGGGLDSGYSNSASATTPPNVQSITISPNTPQTVVTGNTVVYTAVVTDPSGNPIPGQAVNWSVSGGGNVSPANGTGTTFTATTPGGPFTVTAALAGYTNATDNVTVIAAGPVADSINFAMSPTNKGGTLTVVGHDNVVHSINHSFSSPTDPLIIFTPATGNSADGVAFNTAVVFEKAGTFTLTDSLGSSVSTSTAVTVPQILTSISVCPQGVMSCSPTTPITVQALQAQQFTATGHDQFGNNMSLSNVAWSVTGCPGCVSASGSFQTSSIGQLFTIVATSGGKQGAALVNVVSFDVSGAVAYPVPYKANSGIGHIHFAGLGSQSTLHIYTTSGRRVFDISLTSDTYDWNVKNTSGESLASGVYFYVIESPQGKKNGKLIIIQ